MIVSPGAATLGALLVATALAAPARAGSPCQPGETPVRTEYWSSHPVREMRLAAVPGRFLLFWRGELAHAAALEQGAVVGRGALDAFPSLDVSALASSDEGHLLVGIAGTRILGQRLTWDGARIGEVEYLGESALGSGISAAFDGERFVIAWSGWGPGDGRAVRAAIIEPGGEKREAVEVGRTADGEALGVVVAGGVTWIVWTGTATSETGVFGARLARDGTAGAPVRISRSRRVAATVSGDHEAVLAIVDDDGRRDVVRLGADGVIGAPVDVGDAVSGEIVALTRAPGADGYLLWTRPAPPQPERRAFPRASDELTGLALAADGTPRAEAPFVSLRGTTPVFAFDGEELRYAVAEDSTEDRASRLRTGVIAASGAVDAGFVIASEQAEYIDRTDCVRPPSGGGGNPGAPSPGAESDEYGDGCGSCQIAPGATRVGLIAIALLAAILPRRRRRPS